MTRARLASLCLLPLLILAGCASDPEPYGGCLIAVANRREIIRARGFMHAAIPARILLLRSADGAAGHAALVYRLDPEGFVVYDDTFGSRPLRLSWPCAATFPPALTVARAAFPAWPVGRAWWMEPTAPAR